MMRSAKRKLPAWRVVWPWLIVLAMYAVIAWFSAQPGDVSDAQSGAITGRLPFQGNWVAVLVRKLAHVALFFPLGAAAGFAWLRSGDRGPKRHRRAVLRAVALCALLAASDELHQLFVPDRAALVSDVLLDTVSAALGALCAVGAANLFATKRKNR